VKQLCQFPAAYNVHVLPSSGIGREKRLSSYEFPKAVNGFKKQSPPRGHEAAMPTWQTLHFVPRFLGQPRARPVGKHEPETVRFKL
jgi:hypothetical protein